MRLGAHQSIAGGMHLAYARAREDGCEAIQIFTKNKGAWHDPTLERDRIAAFRDARAASPLGSAPVLAHGSYLANLCAKDRALLDRSRTSLLAEVLRCEALGVDHVVFHPGAHLGRGVEAGVELVAESLAWVLERTRGASTNLLIENTAGQGTNLAARFDELGAMLKHVDELAGRDSKKRLGVCIDTCHTFAAGYDISHEAGYDATFEELARHVDLHRVRAFHLNDSQKGLGCRVDRHVRIGEGELGLYPFLRLVNDARFGDTVAVLETPNLGDDRAFKKQLAKMRRRRSRGTVVAASTA